MGRLEENHGAGDLVKSAAIKRFGKPEEVAAVLAFCASEAPGYLTGIDILVDGGTQGRERVCEGSEKSSLRVGGAALTFEQQQ